jgi:phage baseplate assembly protein W
MPIDYYTMPLRLDKLVKGERHERCNLNASIAQQIHLLLTTAFGDMPQDPTFGCSIWEMDFDNLTSGNKLKERIKQSIYQSVCKYEKRLHQIKVDIVVREEELPDKIHGRQVKKRLDVSITGEIRISSEPFQFQDHFFTGPLSYY